MLVHHRTPSNAAVQTAYDILAYLVSHPKAHDTLEGILEWWLLEQRIRQETQHVKDGLALLLAHGFIRQSMGGDTRSHYSLNWTRLDDITKLLQAHEKQDF